MSTPRLAPQLEQLIVELPKAELHVHLEGSIPPGVASTLAQRHGVQLPGAEGGEAGLRSRYRFSDFQAFIDMYLAVSSCLRTSDDFRLATEQVAREMASQNIRYAEVTFTPMTHVDRGVEVDAMMAGLAEGRAEARATHGVELAWVFDIVRTLPHHAQPTLELALAGREEGVVGLGLAGPEGRPHDLGAFQPTFDRARAEGLASLPHAGEMAGASSVHDAVERLGARRIGHGVRCLEDPALVELLRERRIALEVCPSSNVALGVVPSLEQHPLPRLLDAGLQVSLASDDPPLFGTTLCDEYRRCAAQFGWDAQTIIDLAGAAVRQACMDDGAKQRLLAEQQAVVSG